MNTPEGENAPLLRAPPRRPSYAAPSSVRNGIAATLVAGCVVATLAVSGRLGIEPARVDRAATEAPSKPRAAQMGAAPNEPIEGELGNFFTDAWDSTVGELVPSMSFEEPAITPPEGPRPRDDADAGGHADDAEAPGGSDFYPGVEGCEATCESDDVTSESDCVAIGPFCEWGEGKCWSAVGPDPCPTDWGDDADAPAPSEPETKKKMKKGDEAPAPAPEVDDFADAPAPSDDLADAPAPLDDFADAPAPSDDFADAPEPAPEIDLLGELETVYGDGESDLNAASKKQRKKFDALDDDLNDTRRHTKDVEDKLSPETKLKHIKRAIERGPAEDSDEVSTEKKSLAKKTTEKASAKSDAHPTGSITPKKVPALFEAEVFRGDIAEGVSDDVLAQIVRTKMSDNQYEGLFEDLEVKRFEFRVSFDVAVKGAKCPRVSDAAFAEGVKAFVKQARADDAIARFGTDERSPLEKVTDRNSKPAREPEMHDDLDGVLESMAIGGCEDVPSEAPEHDEKDAKEPLTASAHKFRVELVIPRAGPETNAAEMTDRVGHLFDTAHVKKQLEAAHVTKKREDATDVSVGDVTIHGKISVAEKPKR